MPLLADDRGMVADLSLGKGEVVAITVPTLFSNAHLLDADNLAFAYDVVAGHGPVAFDEYVHGYDDDVTLWQALPQPVRAAAWVVAAIVGLALIGANVPFAPPIPAEPPDERDSSAYVDAMAALLRRARPPRARHRRVCRRRAAPHESAARFVAERCRERLPNSSGCASLHAVRRSAAARRCSRFSAYERSCHDR